MIIKMNTIGWPMTFLARIRILMCSALMLAFALGCQNQAYKSQAFVHGSGAVKSNERCAAALTYIKFLVSNKDGEVLVFSKANDHEILGLTGSDWIKPNGGITDSPPDYLIEAANMQPQPNAVNLCNSIRKWLIYNRIRIVTSIPDSFPQASGRKMDSIRQTAIIVNTPVLNNGSSMAICIVKEISGFLSARTYAVYLTKDKRESWEVIAMKDITVA